MIFVNLALFILAFFWIWLGAGLIVSAASKFSRKLKLSPFAFSFVFLGILTSTPEFSVGLQAIADNDPEIFIGNLLGGIVVIFLVIIPLLAVFGNGINLKNELSNKLLLIASGVILLPAALTLDRRVTNVEGIIMIVSYIGLLYLVQRKNGIFDKKNEQLMNSKAYSYKDLLKIILGVGIVFASSGIIVENTIYFSDLLNVSSFYIGLLVVSLGTNLPEISLAIRSIFFGKKELAMGDYLGSAAANTLLFGFFTALNQDEVITVSSFLITFVFISTALALFYLFSNTRKYISRSNGLLMLGIYVLFVFFELLN